MADYVGEYFQPPFYLYQTNVRPSLVYSGHEPPDPPLQDYEAWGGAGVATYYAQRVYDTVLAAWCYYTKAVLDPSPASGETTPNHTGNLLSGSHNVIRMYTA